MASNIFETDESINLLAKLSKSAIQFTITDLKWLNGGLYYLDWKDSYPNLDLPEKEFIFEGKKVKLFEFPSFFEKKMESKIFFHFKRKLHNINNHRPKNKTLNLIIEDGK